MAAERSPFDDDGLHESALILGAESHPRFELACEVLRAMGYKLTTTKQRRHELVVFGPAIDDATLRAIPAKNAYTVDQLFRWIGADGSGDRLSRKLAETIDARKRGSYARPTIEALLEAWPSDSIEKVVRTIDVDGSVVPNPSMRRILRGQSDPRAGLCSRVKVSRAFPREWVSAFLPRRGEFRKELTLDFNAHHDRIEPLREAIELLHGCPLHGLALGQRAKPGSPSLGAVVDSLPEGLRALELSALQPNDLEAFVDVSALRTVEHLSASAEAPISGSIAKFARSFELLRSLSLLSFSGDDALIAALCGTGRIGSLERLKIYRSAINDPHIKLLADACPRRSLRELDLNAVMLSTEGAAMLSSHPSFENLESLTLVPDPRQGQNGENLVRFASASALTALRSLDWKSYSITAPNSVALLSAIDRNPAFAKLESLALRLVGDEARRAFEAVSSPIKLVALQLDCNSSDLLARGDFWRSPWLSSLNSLQISGGYSFGETVTPDSMAEAPASLRSLTFSGLAFSPALVEALSRAPFANNLRELSYFGAEYTAGAITALCTSPFVETLNAIVLSARSIGVDDQWRLRRAFGPALWLI
ncbi:MAG: hypothetical protein U0269_11800 [Polyangiales bacterium]